jgi:hypothetical protein
MSGDGVGMPFMATDWKRIDKGSLVGAVDGLLGKSLKVHGGLVMRGANGRMWVNLPGKPQLDANGVALRDDKGKIKYTSIFEWADRDASDRFSEAVLGAIVARFGTDALG